MKKLQNNVVCTHCNELLPRDSEFCQYCGEKLEKPSKKPKKIATRIIVLALSVIVLVSGSVLAYLYYATPYFEYREAVKTFEQGNYSDAHTMFYLLDDYRDSKQKMKECRKQEALQFLKNKDYNGFFSFYNKYYPQLNFKIPKEYREDFYNAVLDEYEYSESISDTCFNTMKQLELFEFLPNNYKDINKIRKFYNILDNYDYDEYDSEREFLKEYMPELKQLWHYKPVRDWLLSDSFITEFMVGDWRCGSYYLTFYYKDDSIYCQWYAPVDPSFRHDHYQIENKIFKFTRESDNEEYKLYKFSFLDKNTLTAYCYGNGQYYTFKR